MGELIQHVNSHNQSAESEKDSSSSNDEDDAETDEGGRNITKEFMYHYHSDKANSDEDRVKLIKDNTDAVEEVVDSKIKIEKESTNESDILRLATESETIQSSVNFDPSSPYNYP